MTTTALSPWTQVQVWAIQALLVDDKPRTFAEIEQFVGFCPEAALRHMLFNCMISKATIEGFIFFQRITRRK